MKEKIAKLIDLKSIITMIVVAVLAFLVIYLTINDRLTDTVFALFSTVTTMIITYFFTRKKDDNK